MGTDLQELDSRISEEEKKVKTCQNLLTIFLLVGFTCFNSWIDCNMLIRQSKKSHCHAPKQH